MRKKCESINLYHYNHKSSGFHLGSFVWGGGGEDCVQRSIVCEACKVFEPIFEYQSPMHEKTKARVLDIVLIVKTFGEEVGGFGGEASPRTPQ